MQNRAISIELAGGDILKVEPLSPQIVRVRMSPNGQFTPSTTERYGIVRSSWEPVEFRVTEHHNLIEIVSEGICLVLDRFSGSISLRDDRGRLLVEEMRPFPSREQKGAGASFTLEENERFYGLGYRKTDFLQLRGHMLRNHVSYGECYGPSPFLMSTQGWGVYYNTTFDSYFDIGCNQPDTMNIWSLKGELDFYLLTGDMKALLNHYTEITGRPSLMPLWGYGLMFICSEKETQFDVLNDARTFRQEGIPCDMIGLEPGWMSEYYDLSVKKDWNRERFYMPWWSDDRKAFKDVTMIGALERNHFHLSLWLCCDYDVFEEEERQAELNGYPREDPADAPGGLPFGFGKLDFDPRAHAPVYLDKVTVKHEPWFEHLKKFIDQGVAAFKQDPAFIVNDHPDRRYANGMLDDEAHNLWTTVLAKQVHQGYAAYTGKRPMHFMGTAYTGIQKWAPTWACDCGGREEALMSLLHYSMAGHMNTTCDMDVHTPEGIHFGFLQPWSQVNSWAYIAHPWWLGEELAECFRDYARLHYRLIPYIYSYAHIGAKTGLPIVRPMPLVYPEELRFSDLNRQYMLGDWLLITAFSKQVVLPEGTWVDYWTGSVYTGPMEMEYELPPGKGGGLFVKGGAILPCWQNVHHIPSSPVGCMELHIYPEGRTSFHLYEDDGNTFAYEQGAYDETEIGCIQDQGGATILITPVRRCWPGRPDRDRYHLVIHDEKPEALYINDEAADAEAGAWAYDAESRTIRLTAAESPQNRTVIRYRLKEK